MANQYDALNATRSRCRGVLITLSCFAALTLLLLVVLGVGAIQEGDGGHLAWVAPLILTGVAAYWSPSLVAALRTHRQVVPIFIINLLLGVTVIGWIAALVWAAAQDKRQ